MARRNCYLEQQLADGRRVPQAVLGLISNQTPIVPRAGLDAQSNPVTYNVYNTRPCNGSSGTVIGFEVAAQHSFGGTGSCPAWAWAWAPTTPTSPASSASSRQATAPTFERLSKDSHKINAFYEKYGIHARGAYNWRSTFLAVRQGYQGQPQNTGVHGQVDVT